MFDFNSYTFMNYAEFGLLLPYGGYLVFLLRNEQVRCCIGVQLFLVACRPFASFVPAF